MITKIFLIFAMALLANSQAGLRGISRGSTVTVTGTGTVARTPDMATFSFTFRETAQLSKDASAAVNIKVNRALRILASNNVDRKDIQTTSLNISPQYDPVSQTVSRQQASQTVSVKLHNIDSNGENIGSIAGSLSKIDGITLSGITFDVEDKTSMTSQARIIAFNDAKAKAQQNADQSGKVLGDAIETTEKLVNNTPGNANAFSIRPIVRPNIPTGQKKVTLEITIKFQLW